MSMCTRRQACDRRSYPPPHKFMPLHSVRFPVGLIYFNPAYIELPYFECRHYATSICLWLWSVEKFFAIDLV